MKLAPHKSIREQYNPTPSAKEKRFHLELMDNPCTACSADPPNVFHHTLSEFPEKRWRRDHQMGFQLCDDCHRSLHAYGDEWAWCAARGFDPVETSLYNIKWGKRQRLL